MGLWFFFGGLTEDNCDNIYVANDTIILMLDPVSLSTTKTFQAKARLFDLQWNSTNKLYACGKGFISSYDLTGVSYALTTEVSSTKATGCSNCDGTATVTPSVTCGKIPNLQYSWSAGGQTTQTATGLCPGTYSVSVIQYCKPIVTHTVSVSGNLSTGILSTNVQDVQCANDSNGIASAVVTGGASPFLYTWMPGGQTTASISGLAPGNYSVSVTDNNGCSTVSSVTITSPPVINDSMLVTPTACGNADGTATVFSSGGTQTYTYSWSNNKTTQTISGLAAGNYTVTIKDSKGCTQQTIAIIDNTNGPTATSISSSPSCNNSEDGTASITPSGGTLPYTYSWTNSASNQSTSSVSGLAAGDYSVTIIDANNCRNTLNITVTAPEAVSGNISSTPTSCNSQSGTASVAGTGGASPYTYSWSNGQSSQSISLLDKGTYTVTLTDSKGCTGSNTVVINNNSNFKGTTSSSATNCFGDSTGSATASVSGGTGPYSFSWSNGGTSATITNSAATTYTVKATDANGCSFTNVIVITQPNQLSISTLSTSVTAGHTDGSISVIASGGTPGYNYSWSTTPSASTSTVSGLPVGLYSVTAIDSKGCLISDTIRVTSDDICGNENVFVPTAFSPNGDGVNDEFKARGKCFKEFSLEVFNRWGEKVFKTNDPSASWNGYWRGVLENSGVFVWSLKGVTLKGEQIKMKGNVTLVR